MWAGRVSFKTFLWSFFKRLNIIFIKGYLESRVTARYWYSITENTGTGRIFILKPGWIWNRRVRQFMSWWAKHFIISEFAMLGESTIHDVEIWDRQLNTQIIIIHQRWFNENYIAFLYIYICTRQKLLYSSDRFCLY